MTPSFRPARGEELPQIVQLLVDDSLGAARESLESPLPESYGRMFERIDADPNNELVVAELEGELVGCMQLTFIPYLSYKGSWRCLVESVRVRRELRGRGIGAAMMQHAIGRARARGCRLIQLTSDKSREDAHRFYERLGFARSHDGFKLLL